MKTRNFLIILYFQLDLILKEKGKRKKNKK